MKTWFARMIDFIEKIFIMFLIAVAGIVVGQFLYIATQLN